MSLNYSKWENLDEDTSESDEAVLKVQPRHARGPTLPWHPCCHIAVDDAPHCWCRRRNALFNSASSRTAWKARSSCGAAVTCCSSSSSGTRPLRRTGLADSLDSHRFGRSVLSCRVVCCMRTRTHRRARGLTWTARAFAPLRHRSNAIDVLRKRRRTDTIDDLQAAQCEACECAWLLLAAMTAHSGGGRQ